MSVSPELEKYIANARQSGMTDDVIKQKLFKIGWSPLDVEALFAPASIKDMSSPSVGDGVPLASSRHHVGSTLFFFVILGINFFLGYVGNRLGSKSFVVGIFVMAFLLTAIFAFLLYIARKIGKRFGRKGTVTTWLCILLFLGAGVWHLSQNSASYVLYPNGSIILNKDISLDECITTKDETIKYACGIEYAVTLKDRTLCRKVYGNNDGGYFCEYTYDDYYHTHPNDIRECQSMIGTTANEMFYKDGCFTSVAVSTSDKQICSYLSSEDSRVNCVQGIEAHKYAKDMLCGPLYDNGALPRRYECDEYVFSLHDLTKCSLLTPNWNKDACTVYVKDFMSHKSEYDRVKQSKASLVSAFDSRSGVQVCSYEGGGPGTAFAYHGQCKYSRAGDILSLQIKNSSIYPLVFSSSVGKFSELCSNSYIKSIDGGDNFTTQIDAGEVFLLEIQCPGQEVNKLKQLYIPTKISGSAQEVSGSLRINLQSQ